LRRFNSAIVEFVRQRFSRSTPFWIKHHFNVAFALLEFTREDKDASTESFNIDESVLKQHLHKRSWVPFERARNVSEDSIPITVESSNWSSLASPTVHLAEANEFCHEHETQTFIAWTGWNLVEGTALGRPQSGANSDSHQPLPSHSNLRFAPGVSLNLDISFLEEITLGQYLGGGSAASVYEGVWNGHTVHSILIRFRRKSDRR